MKISSRIAVRDGGVEVSIKFQLWGDKNEGRGVVAFDPKDENSRAFMIADRPFLKTAIGAKYNLGDLSVYESQGNGRYMPVKDGKFLDAAGGLTEKQLHELGDSVDHRGWSKTMELSNHSLPPPTLHGRWPK